MNTDFYRQAIPDLNLSIERETGQVPSDGKYHVVRDGTVLESFRLLKQAQEHFKKIVKESNYKPKHQVKRKSGSELNIDRNW